MTRKEALLVMLMEECNEVAQRASKILRFGVNEVQPGQEKTNAQRLMDEVEDFIGVYQMITGCAVAPSEECYRRDPVDVMAGIMNKKAKVEKFLEYSKECGTITD